MGIVDLKLTRDFCSGGDTDESSIIVCLSGADSFRRSRLICNLLTNNAHIRNTTAYEEQGGRDFDAGRAEARVRDKICQSGGWINSLNV